MADEFVFDPETVLGDRLSELTPEQFVKLIQGLCQGVQSRGEGFYGGINVSNVSLSEDGAVGLGEGLTPGENQRYSPEQIEYLAPEVFWKNEGSPQADVYGIGLMMYTWLNGGCLPFLYPDPPATDRAEALRRRMSGEDFPIPPISESLAVIIRKATAYAPADRYESCAALLDAFQVFAEEAAANGPELAAAIQRQREKQAAEEQMMAGILAAAEAAAAPRTAPAGAGAGQQYQVDKSQPKDSGNPNGEKKFNARPLVVVLLIAALILVAAVAMSFTSRKEPGDPNATMTPTPPLPPVTSVSPNPEETQEPDTTPEQSPDSSAEPSESPEPSAEPTTTPTPTPTPTPVVTPKPDQTGHQYQLIISDASWNKAADNCINAGGNLVVINDEAEFKKVTELADSYGVEFVWVGGFRKSGQIVWVNGETSDYYPWAEGEPSYTDTDGTAENFLLLWKRNGVWTYNDSRDDPAGQFPGAYSGKIAYILETEG